MKIEPRQMLFYDWFKDIRPALSRHIGISDNMFRNYHKIIDPNGKTGLYCDFWHVWLSFHENNQISNGSFVKVYFTEDEEYFREKLLKEFGEWSLKLLDAKKALFEEQGWDINKCIVVLFSW